MSEHTHHLRQNMKPLEQYIDALALRGPSHRHLRPSDNLIELACISCNTAWLSRRVDYHEEYPVLCGDYRCENKYNNDQNNPH